MFDSGNMVDKSVKSFMIGAGAILRSKFTMEEMSDEKMADIVFDLAIEYANQQRVYTEELFKMVHGIIDEHIEEQRGEK